jgi:hypothetical protein
MGHKLDVATPQGATQATVVKSDGTLVGVSEPRLVGKAAGE